MNAAGPRASAGNGRRWLRSSVLVLALVLSATSCRSATEIVLKIDTDLPCTDPAQWRGVAVYLGTPGALLEQPTLVTSECDARGYVGSVVVAPSGDKDALVGVSVVAGVSRNPEECEAAQYGGCIVARRALRYTPHESLELRVSLLEDCVSQPCDPNNTCVAGRCVDSDFVAPPPAPTVPSGPPPPSVRCGDSELRCPVGESVCCLTVDVSAQTTSGECLASSELCTGGRIPLNCDDDSDCAAYDSPNTGDAGCFLSYTPPPNDNRYWTPIHVSHSECRALNAAVGAGLTLCQDHKACGVRPCVASSGVENGSPNQLPGYLWCQFGQ